MLQRLHNKILKLASGLVAKNRNFKKALWSSDLFAIFWNWLKSLTVLEFSWRFKNCHDFEADLKTYSHTVRFLKSQVQKLNQLLCKISRLNNCDSSVLIATGYSIKKMERSGRLTPRLAEWPLRGHTALSNFLEDIFQPTKSKLSPTSNLGL